VVLADVRWYLDGSSGRDAYESGHLPGAVFVDLDRWLSGPASRQHGRNPLPIPAVFAAGMSASGIGDGDVVVAYDDAGGVIAARLVWMLRSMGHPAAVLDGGMAAYDGALETAAPAIQPRAFTERPWPADALAGIDETVEDGAVVVDARNRDRYEGRQDPIDPRQAAPGELPEGRHRVSRRGHLLLRFRCHRLPQPPGDGACWARPRPALRRWVVAVWPRLTPSRRDEPPAPVAPAETLVVTGVYRRNAGYQRHKWLGERCNTGLRRASAWCLFSGQQTRRPAPDCLSLPGHVKGHLVELR